MSNLETGHCVVNPLEKNETCEISITLLSEFEFVQKAEVVVVLNSELKELYPMPELKSNSAESDSLFAVKDLLYTEVNIFGCKSKLLYNDEASFKGISSSDQKC